MDKNDLIERLTAFAIRIVKMVDCMPNTIASNAIAKQVVRSGTSPSANYRAACIGKSDKDFVNKLKMVEEELDETSHWLMIIMKTDLLKASRVEDLYNENIELLKIITKSIITTKARLKTEELNKKNTSDCK